jgi:2-dehydropantoate 2-reductase
MVLQNGINTEEKLKKIFPDNMVLGALAFTCINRIAPTKIQHLDYGLVKIGSLNPEFKKQARQVAEIFAAAGIKAAFDANLRRLRWEKLLWNVPFNSLSVVCLRASTAELMKDEALLPYIYNLMYEVRLIANAEGNKINKKAIFEMVERTRKMTPYKTSMLLDFEGGREMEVEAILGEPLRLAQKYKIKAPNIESIYRILSYYNHTNIPNHSSR